MAQDMWQACDNGDLVGIYEMREKLEEVYNKQIHGLANWRALIDDEIYQVARTQRKARVAEAEGKKQWQYLLPYDAPISADADT